MKNDKEIAEIIMEQYVDQECPDCGEPIPEDIGDGEECINCGHVFYAPEGTFHKERQAFINEIVNDIIDEHF